MQEALDRMSVHLDEAPLTPEIIILREDFKAIIQLIERHSSA
jgi:hypothetical protein